MSGEGGLHEQKGVRALRPRGRRWSDGPIPPLRNYIALCHKLLDRERLRTKRKQFAHEGRSTRDAETAAGSEMRSEDMTGAHEGA